VNPAFCAITGYSKDEAVGQRTNLLKSGRQDDALYAKLWKTILSGQTWRGEFENRRKDGSIVSMEASITPVRGPRGGITSFICMEQDITERRALEHQLLQAQKFEAIGQLAGGIAHDFNNVLAAILVAESLGTDIEMTTEPAPDLASIHVDPAQIEQILMNLCVNARDAMPQGGRLTIATANVHFDEDDCRPRPGIAPGDYVRLSVADTGMGMDPATLERIFEPFFTTKPPGRGTG